MGNLPQVPYQARDMEAILQRMVENIPALTEGRWTDRSPSDVGITILELLSWSLEALHFYQDRAANEAFLPTARERKNIINLCKLIAYRLDGVTSSTATLEFSVAAPAPVRIVIPRLTRVTTSGGDESVPFATIEEAYLLAGETSVLVAARQGTPLTEAIRTSGQPNQKYTLAEEFVDAQSIRVEVAGVVWEVVDSFVNSQASDRHYIVDLEPSTGKTFVQFGDGFFGAAPPFSSVDNGSISYLSSLGLTGNVGAATLTTLIDTLYDTNDDPVSVSVTNEDPATGGDEAETIDHARVQAPAELSALYRAMTKYDFMALANGYPGVAKSSCWGEAEVDPPNYNLFNWVLTVIAPNGVTRDALILDVDSGQPSEPLIEAVRNFLYSRCTLTTRIKVSGPVYRPVVLGVTVYRAKEASEVAVKRAAEDAVTDFFAFENVEFGREIRLSNLIELLDALDGVEYVVFDQLAFKPPGEEPPESDEVAEFLVLNPDELPYLYSYTITVERATPQPTLPTTYPNPSETLPEI